MSLDITSLLKQIQGEDARERETALNVIYAHDEEAISSLIDEFYAGVSESTGIVIIQLVSKIGGYEARQLLEDILQNPPPYASWQETAQTGMTYNAWK